MVAHVADGVASYDVERVPVGCCCRLTLNERGPCSLRRLVVWCDDNQTRPPLTFIHTC